MIDKIIHDKIDNLEIYKLNRLLEEVIVLYQFWASRGYKGITKRGSLMIDYEATLTNTQKLMCLILDVAGDVVC